MKTKYFVEMGGLRRKGVWRMIGDRVEYTLSFSNQSWVKSIEFDTFWQLTKPEGSIKEVMLEELALIF